LSAKFASTASAKTRRFNSNYSKLGRQILNFQFNPSISVTIADINPIIPITASIDHLSLGAWRGHRGARKERPQFAIGGEEAAFALLTSGNFRCISANMMKI
jgi:hypothetical protein